MEESANYELGSKGTGWEFGTPRSLFNLETGKLKISGADMTYHDKEGNEITKEQFNELRIKILEEKLKDLETTIDTLTDEIAELQI